MCVCVQWILISNFAIVYIYIYRVSQNYHKEESSFENYISNVFSMCIQHTFSPTWPTIDWIPKRKSSRILEEVAFPWGIIKRINGDEGEGMRDLGHTQPFHFYTFFFLELEARPNTPIFDNRRTPPPLSLSLSFLIGWNVSIRRIECNPR